MAPCASLWRKTKDSIRGDKMMEINSRNLRFLSRLGARGVLGQALYDLACENQEFFAISADLSKAAGYDRLERDYPNLCINTGIAEQSMIGTAAGLSYTGIPVYACSWAVFSALRIADQMRNYMGNMNCNIKLIGMDSGLTKSCFGISHANPQDIALFRSQPNVRIIAPSDGISIYKIIRKIQKDKIPTYIRLTGGDTLPIIYREDMDFPIGKSIEINAGQDVVILSTGIICSEALKAQEILAKSGVAVSVVDCYSLKPFDVEMLSSQQNKKLIVTLEEHSVCGGLGGIVAEYFAGLKNHPPILSLGIRDEIVSAQTYEEALKEYGLDAISIADAVLKKLENL